MVFGVGDIVGEVGEVGLGDLKAFGFGDGLFEAEVGVVWCPAQAVDDHGVEALEERVGAFGDGAAVGQVGDIADAVAHGVAMAVDERNGLDVEGTDADEVLAVEFPQLDAWDEPAVFEVVVVEDVVEVVADEIGVVLAGVERECLAAEAGEAAEIIDAMEVIGVGVGEKDGIDAHDVLADDLFAEIGADIDEDAGVIRVDPGSGAQVAIAWVGGVADGAVAADHRHAV